MAAIDIGFFSEVLGMATHCRVILPQPRRTDIVPEPYPTVYLLHGIGEDHTAWTRRSCIERYAVRYGCLAIMPDMHNSSVEDMAHGGRWLTYIAEELPRILQGFFPISDRREDTFVLGTSMGGYSALKLGLRFPERYAAVGSLSAGFTSLPTLIRRPDSRGITPEWLTFGPQGVRPTDEEMHRRVRTLAEAPVRPRVYMAIGEEDTLLMDNVLESARTFEALPGNPFSLRFDRRAGGHSWDVWDGCVCSFLEFCGLTPVHGFC